MTEDQVLLALCDGPVSRSSAHGFPYAMMTELMDRGLVGLTRLTFSGFGTMSVSAFCLTDAGKRHVEAMVGGIPFL